MRDYLPVFAVLFFAWASMTLAAFFIPWPLLPDVVVVIVVYLQFFAPSAPRWRCVLPLSLLMDMAARVCFGSHGLLYGLVALSALPLRRAWQRAPLFERLFAVVSIAVVFQIAKFLLYFLVAAVPAPVGWYFTMLAQIVVWPLVCWLVRPYLPREVS